MFDDYSDVLTVSDVMRALGICKNNAYQLLSSGQLKSKKIGRKYLIPKKYLIDYIYSI